MTEIPRKFNLARWLLEENLEQRPDKVAVQSPERDLSYRQVADEATRLQAALAAGGVQPEQRVLMVLPDVAEFVTTWLAVVRGGAVFAMVNPRLPGEDYEYYLEYSRAPVAVVHSEALEAFAPAARAALHLRQVIRVGPARPEVDLGVPVVAYEEAVQAEPAEPFDSDRDDIAGWLFTSGTSGKPKAAIHFHRDFRFNIDRYCKQVLALGEDDRTMAVSKLFFGYATGTNLMFPFAVGGSTALFPERSTPANVLQRLAQYRPTMLAAVPTTLAGILREPGDVDDAFASVRMILSAGEALPQELQQTFQARFGVEILDGIGSAEMFHIYVSNYPGDVKPGSLGRLVPGYEVRVVAPDGREAATGESGVMWVRGGSTAAGYWLDREKSRATFQGDWTVTGDLFRRDEAGYFWYEGRADDMLKVGGIWVAPREVEDCLATHDAVEECCVVGHENAEGLVTPLAFVVLADGRAEGPETVAALQEYVKERLAKYKAPRHLRFVEALPRNDRGKIARAELKRRAQQEGKASHEEAAG